MRYLTAGIAGALWLASVAGGADLPPVTDGYGHGDPPFLLESGWKPLLNGRTSTAGPTARPRSWDGWPPAPWSGAGCPIRAS